MDKTQKRVKNIIAEIADSYPAATITLNRMNFRPTNKIPTAACDYCGNGIYNPEFFDTLSDMNIKAVLLHEALHLYFNHFKRFVNIEGQDSYDDIIKKESEYATKLQAWNIAADSFINEVIIKELPANSLPDNCITFSDIKKMTGMSRSELKKSSTEKVYKVLLENQDQMMQQLQELIKNAMSQMSEDNSNGSSNSNFDNNQSGQGQGNISGQGTEKNNNDSKNQVTITVVLDEDTQKIIDETYGKSKSENNVETSSTDNTDSKLADDIKSIRAGNHDCHSEIEIIDKVVSITNIEWKELLSEFVYSISGKASSGRTWQRPSRRYRDVYPISQGRKRKVKTKDFTFAIDVSGSMDKNKIRRAFDVVLDYAKENEMACKYYFWSTNQSSIYDFSTEKEFAENLKKHYGGGTSLSSALNNYNCEGIGEGLIVVTDLEFDKITKDDIDRFGGPLVFLDIEPNSNWSSKTNFVSAIESAGGKYAKFY